MDEEMFAPNIKSIINEYSFDILYEKFGLNMNLKAHIIQDDYKFFFERTLGRQMENLWKLSTAV